MSQCPSPLPKSAPHPAPVISTSAGGAILALDLGTTTGWASLAGGIVHSGTASFRSGRFDGGGMRYLRFQRWLEQLADDSSGLAAIYFEEVRRHIGTDAAHLYGGFLATLTAWCEREGVAYQGVPVGTIKTLRHGQGQRRQGCRARRDAPARVPTRRRQRSRRDRDPALGACDPGERAVNWTPSLVEERLAEAASVLKRLPEPRRQGHFNVWPEILHSFADKVGQEPRPMRVVPSPAAISRMEETLTWTVGLDPIDGKIVWLRAYGERWKTICWTVGLQRSAAHEHWLYALCVIAWRLNRRKVPRLRSRRYVIEMVKGAE